MSDLNGCTALVTGGAQGIGRRFASALAGAGADVAIFDLNDAGETARVIVDETGARCLALTGDVSEEGDVSRAVDMMFAELGRIDILVNNAAYMATMPIVAHTELCAAPS